MILFEKTAKISSKGQITLPKRVREYLSSDVVRVVIEDGKVEILPVPDLGGSLKNYAERYVPLDEVREQAWKMVADEETGCR